MISFRFIKNNRYYFFGILLLLLIVFVNRFPQGYVFGGGDTIQLINAKESFKNLFFDWQGRASIFYSIFYMLSLLGVNDTIQLSFYLGIFIIGSYVSFDIFTRLIFKEAPAMTRLMASLFYALNLFTLYIFTANWGYSYFLSLYIFIPSLVGLYMKYIETRKYTFGAFFVLALFIASSGFGNPAFAISFSIFLLFLTSILILIGKIKISNKFILNIFIILFFSVLVNAYWIVTIIPTIRAGVQDLFTGNIIDLNWWLSHTSNPIMNTFRMIHYSDDYFPDNFPYRVDFLKTVFKLMSFLPAILVLLGLVFVGKMKNKYEKYFLSFGALLVLLTMLVTRLRPPFEMINYYIYNIWGMNTLRGYDKTAIYIPFIIGVLLLILFIQLKNRKLAFSLMLLIILIPLPFYTGKIQQNLSYRFSNSKAENKDFRKAKYSFLIKIPEEYYKIRNTINNNTEKSFVATLPYSSNDGSGIANYPKWKLYGGDITAHLYSKDLIEANRYYFKGWNFAQEFNSTNRNPEWVIELLGMMNSGYIIYHKDVPEKSLGQTKYKMKELEEIGKIEKLEDNSYFNLYKINKGVFVPYITWQKNKIEIDANPSSITRNFEKVKNNSQEVEFEEINPKKYLVKVQKKHFENLILSEPYEKNWKAYAVKKNGQEIELKNHFVARGYANGWEINIKDVNEIIIEYYPVRLMWKGIVVSLLATLLLSIYLVYCIYVKKNRHKENQ